MLKRTILVASALLSTTAVANATITDIHWETVDGDPAVAGSVQNTLFTTMTNDWTNAVILIDLTAGSLLDPISAGLGHNLRAGGNENDSWLDSPDDPLSVSVTTNVYDFTTGYFDWFDTGNNGGIVNGIAARLYATDNAMGTFEVQMFDRDSAGMQTTLTGDVVNGFFTSGPMPLAGDYNADGVVDAADYTVWRDHLGEADETNLNNNGDGGDVSANDYDRWTQNFGMTNLGGSSVGLAPRAIPEPSTLLILLSLGFHRCVGKNRRR